MITRIDTVTLYVFDQRRSRDFYIGTLGFDLATDSDMGEMGRWIEVVPPGAQTAFALVDGGRFGRSNRIGDSADVALSCPDVRALHARLAALGVAVSEPEARPFGIFLNVADPDGHEFVVSQE